MIMKFNPTNLLKFYLNILKKKKKSLLIIRKLIKFIFVILINKIISIKFNKIVQFHDFLQQ